MIFTVEVEGLGVMYSGGNERRAKDEFFYYARESSRGAGNAASKRVKISSSTGFGTLYDPKISPNIPRV